MKSSTLVSLLLSALHVSQVQTKFASGFVSIGGNKEEHRWKYLSKFGYRIGTGKYEVRIRTIRPYIDEPKKMRLGVYCDEEWEQVEERNICDRLMLARTNHTITIQSGGDWSNWMSGKLVQWTRPHVWYFAADDCKDQFNLLTRFRFEFRASQFDGSELSVEMSHMGLILFLEVVLSCVFIRKYFHLCKRFYQSAQSLHPVIWTLSFGIGLQFLSLVCSLLHIYSYSSNGTGIRAMDIIAEILSAVSHVLLTSLLILLGLGYTLLQSNLGQLDIVIPIVFIICIVHVLLVGFGKIKDDASYKFHENEGVVGWIILTVRLALYIWFLWAVNSSSREAKTSEKMQSFFRNFKSASTTYFLSYPVIFMICCVCAPYVRHYVFSIGTFCMQAMSIFWLTNLFLSRGDYFEVSTLNSSFLPGGSRSSSFSKSD